MSRNRTVVLSLAIYALLPATAFAGPASPCITATQSANGNVLVTDTLGFDHPNETHPRKIISSVYQVYRRSTTLNASSGIDGPNAYWGSAFWKVEFHYGAKPLLIACTYILVPDSGEYLVFVGSRFSADALTIYRHRAYDPALGPLVSQQGKLVREIKLAELWPSDPPLRTSTDHTPEWFEGGTFTFSSDQQLLNFRDKSGRKLEIDLHSGELRHAN